MDSGTETDAQLVRAIGHGDQQALARAFDRYAATLTRYAWAVVESQPDVEEAVQDTFLTLWHRAETLELPADTMLPWLLVVCRNHALNAGRKQARRRVAELPEELPAPDDHAEAVERLRWVRDEIAALPDTDRRICELCLVQGYSYAEAAQMLGLSVGAVTQRVARSRTRLRKAVMHDEH